MTKSSTVVLHYSAPPVIGGVEAVILAHAKVFLRAEYGYQVVAGRGDREALPQGAKFSLIPEMDSQHPEILKANRILEAGGVPNNFETMIEDLIIQLEPIVSGVDNIIVHNVLTKHFNLPLTAAIYRLQKAYSQINWLAWCHDFTWTSPNSRKKVFEGYPWDLLRTHQSGFTYIVVSEYRRNELANLFNCDPGQIQVIYNGVEPVTLLGFSNETTQLIERLDLKECDLVILMPVRVTQAKNFEYAIEFVACLKSLGVKPKLIVTGPPDPHEEKSMQYFQELMRLRQRFEVENEFRFVFESGPIPDEGYEVDLNVVGDLYRASDMLFMPSRREGFGMPILEAGLVGLPVVATGHVPAAREIGRGDILQFSLEEKPMVIAKEVLTWLETDKAVRLRSRVRRNFEWESIFSQKIEKLLK